jgi:hypothetical protein
MMRRTTWLAAGALLGVFSYRRLDRAAKSLTGHIEARPVGQRPAAATTGLITASRLRSAARITAGAAGWLVRQGRRGCTAGGRPNSGAAGFIGDVRDGMDEYLGRHQANIDRQYHRAGNTLVTQRASGRVELSGADRRRESRWRERVTDSDKTKDGS